MSKKVKIVLLIIVIITAGFVTYVWQSLKKPLNSSESSFLLNEMFYSCSHPIDGAWTRNDGYFHPFNQEDFQKYCRTEAIIEYRAVLDILRRDDINQLIAKYNTSEAWVRALSHQYINDKDYLKRILPAYRDVKIDCIIVVHSPEGTRFFIENGDRHESHEDHQYLELSAAEFLASLNKTSNEDVTNFWLGLH